MQKTNEKFNQVEGIQGDSVYDQVFEVTIPITNNGTTEAAEIVQLYLNFPEEVNQPPSLLRGFDKLLLKKGESKDAKFSLRRKDLSVWNTFNQEWEIPEAITKDGLEFWVGASSRDVRQRGVLKI